MTFVVAVSTNGNARPSLSLVAESDTPRTAPYACLGTPQPRDILEKNFLKSPCLCDTHPRQVLLQENFTSAALAYNDAIDKSVNDLIVFCHQDIFFPDAWVSQLQAAIRYLESHYPKWGVLGCSGTTRDGDYRGYVYSLGVGYIGKPSEPAEVQTLDEIVLIMRKSSGLRFDETLPHFHLYGADICLRAAMQGMKSYAISAFCVHNTNMDYRLSDEFYEGCEHIRRRWKELLPIQTTCIRITKVNMPIYWRRFRERCLRYIRSRKQHKVTRVSDVKRLFEELSLGM